MSCFSMVKSSFKNSSYKKHFHDTYSISIIISGECDIEIDSKKYIFKKGDIRVINPYEIHQIYPSSWEHINFILSSYYVHTILQNDFIYKFNNFINDDILVTKLLNADKNDIAKIVKYMAQNYLKNKSENFYSKEDKFYKAIAYMYQNANRQDLNLDEIASQSGMSKYHFLREFKKRFSITPYRYLQNIKINNAKKMMRYGLSFSEIALECGFVDQSHLINSYKKFYGHTPSKVI